MKRFSLYPFVALSIVVFIHTGCSDPLSLFPPPDFSGIEIADTTAQQVEKVQSDDGLIYYVISEGEGNWTLQGRANERVSLFLTLKTKDGEIIQSTRADGRDVPEVVRVESFFDPKGLLEGILGMKEGERRVVVVPPPLGFADAAPNSQFYSLREETLVYDVELIEILSN